MRKREVGWVQGSQAEAAGSPCCVKGVWEVFKHSDRDQTNLGVNPSSSVCELCELRHAS